jgi:SAM-dependent methyltransferase
MYYDNKIDSLKDIFGTADVTVSGEYIRVSGRRYPVIDDVIIILDQEMLPEKMGIVKKVTTGGTRDDRSFAEDVQFSFGEEWKKFPQILPEHKDEFFDYFDLVNLDELGGARLCDAGCGIGRWSYFLKDKCKELVLIDFSEAIFVARQNLREADNAIFFMGDITKLPFRKEFADILISIGVLHHLPVPALREVRALSKFAPVLLIYLYYALDNRPFYFRVVFTMSDIIRRTFSKTRSPAIREALTWIGTLAIYMPLIGLGTLLRPFGLADRVPLYEAYHDKGIKRIRQDVYDRFFTSIEQRFTKMNIYTLLDSFNEVVISERIPYWHFICKK